MHLSVTGKQARRRECDKWDRTSMVGEWQYKQESRINCSLSLSPSLFAIHRRRFSSFSRDTWKSLCRRTTSRLKYETSSYLNLDAVLVTVFIVCCYLREYCAVKKEVTLYQPIIHKPRTRPSGFFYGWPDGLELSGISEYYLSPGQFAWPGHLQRQLQSLSENISVFDILAHLALYGCYDDALYNLTT